MDGILLLGWGTLLAVLDEVLNGLHGDLLQRPCEMLCMKLKIISGRVLDDAVVSCTPKIS